MKEVEQETVTLHSVDTHIVAQAKRSKGNVLPELGKRGKAEQLLLLIVGFRLAPSH